MITVIDRDGWGPQFTLTSRWFSYSCAVLDGRFLTHLYWGPPLAGSVDPGYAVTPTGGEYLPTVAPSAGGREGAVPFSLERLPREYPAWGTGDGRSGAFGIRFVDGTTACRLEYESYEILEGPIQPPGMVVIHAGSGTAGGGEAGHFRTLRVRLKDPRGDVAVDLFYLVGDEESALVRWCRFSNVSADGFVLHDPASVSVDLDGDNHDVISFSGAWGRERHVVRRPVTEGRFERASRNGAGGHQGGPFLALADRDATERRGLVRAIALAYSGNVRIACDTDPFEVARLTAGIGGVAASVEAGGSFDTPPAVLVCSDGGFSGMSDAFHRFVRRNVVPPRWRDEPRKVVINSWEAMYHDVDAKRIVELARRGREIGAELLVLDDGWFSDRRNDTSSLGDWWYNEERFPDGIGATGDAVRREGLDFGLWIEPEMVSPDSRLFREHPEWVVGVAGREHTLARNQLVLDLSNGTVVDYLEETVAAVLREARPDYVKWDMNRNLTEAASPLLPPERQGEMLHLYVLGLYDLMDRLTRRFPDVLFEGCAGGGGRLDLGLAYYVPRFWTSDQTDAVERLPIQYGTSLLFPPELMGAHVSTAPNHQVGRVTPASTRVLTALAFSFGFELDPARETEEDRAIYLGGAEVYKRIRGTLVGGRFVRISGPLADGRGGSPGGGDFSWMVVSADEREAFVFWFRPLRRGVRPVGRLRLHGLRLPAYTVAARNEFITKTRGPSAESDLQRIYETVYLETAGLPLPPPTGDYQAAFFHLREQREV